MEDGEFPLVPVVLPRIVDGGLDKCPSVVEQAECVFIGGPSGVRAQIEILLTIFLLHAPPLGVVISVSFSLLDCQCCGQANCRTLTLA